jgi:hypothetical protein
MKSSIMGLASILLFIMLPSISLGACPPGKSCIDIYDGSSGEVIGDDSFLAETSYDDWQNDGITAALTNGVTVQLEIPDGNQGSVKALMSRSGTSSASPVLNGDRYFLDTSFRGKFWLGAEKTSDMGAASAEASIFSKASVDNGFSDPDVCPDCKNDRLSGEATISVRTSNTGTGGTYAIVDGASASYKVTHRYPSGVQANEAVDGTSSVKHIEIQTCDTECPDCCRTCESEGPAGSAAGFASISARSDANYFSSNSYSDIRMNASSDRQNSGSSAIAGTIIESSATGNARDGSAPSAKGYNAQTIIRSKSIAASSYAFAAMDMDSSGVNLGSQASHNLANSTDRANNWAEVCTSIKRTDLNSPLTIARANAAVSDVYFKADARDLRSSQKYAFNCITVSGIQSREQLVGISDIWNGATLKLMAMRTGDNAISSVSEDISNYGPKISGNSSDVSNIEAHYKSLRAEAKVPKETRFIGMTSRDITCFMLGNNPNPAPVRNIKGFTFGSGIKKEVISDTCVKQGSTRILMSSSQKIND